MRSERCCKWVAVGGYETICRRPDDHEGECLPFRSDVMDAADALAARAQALYDAVVAIDQDGGWPYEGPGEGE